jgi:hypothetical protein
MAQIVQNGQPVPFTCENRRYRTNVTKGKRHRPSATLGSVFDDPLLQVGSYTLWVEYVTEIRTGDECFWLMWYEGDVPTIPLSAVFDRDQYAEMVSRLPRFIP